MKKNKTPANATPGPATRQEPRRVRLPGFLVEEDIGLGDVLKRASYAIGIKPCGGCEKRAATMNRWVVFFRKPK
jgi:hypothetical protein